MYDLVYCSLGHKWPTKKNECCDAILLASEVILDMISGILSKYQESVLEIDMDGRCGGEGDSACYEV